jgi:hypothetical protein
MHTTVWMACRLPWAWATTLQMGQRACDQTKRNAAQGTGATKESASCAQKARMGPPTDSPQPHVQEHVERERTEIKKVFKTQVVLANALLVTGAGLGRQNPKNMRVEVDFTAPQVVLGLLP